MEYRLGVDVGGTNTDAVILTEKNEVIAHTKSHTTLDIQTGITNSVNKVLQNVNFDKSAISTAMLGTTQCTNAIVERKNLISVGVIRLGYPATLSLPPFTDWPADLVKALHPLTATLHGGNEFDGRKISQFDDAEVTSTLEKWRGKVSSLAVIGVFSPVNDEEEKRVAELAHQLYGDNFPVSCSAAVGSLGLIERENATILNSALNQVMQRTAAGFINSLQQAGVSAATPYLCQNDGTLMSIDYARQHPILTIGSGPTNSIRGAAYLSSLENAMVMDIGGTTSDLGVLVNGFPRESSVAVDVGGIRTNFRMPDILSIGLGGGSIVRQQEDGSVTVGPDSVGYQIEDKALCFGGDTVTTTDIAVRLGQAQIGDPQLVQKKISLEFAQKAAAKIKAMLEESIDNIKTEAGDVDLLLVGGGAIVAPQTLKGVGKIYRDSLGSVANAIGATIAQIGGEYERLYTYDKVPRKEALADAQQKATDQAVQAGADGSTAHLVSVEETPIAYAPGNTTKVKLKVVGSLHIAGQ